MPIPEINTLDRYRAILAKSVKTREDLTTLHQVDSDGREYDLSLAANEWNVVAGRPGLLLYVIPHPMGSKQLWMTAFYVAPNSSYTGSHINQRRIITVLEGEITCNGQHYGPGESMTIEPQQSTDWNARSGATGVTLYEFVLPAAPLPDPPLPAGPAADPEHFNLSQPNPHYRHEPS